MVPAPFFGRCSPCLTTVSSSATFWACWRPCQTSRFIVEMALERCGFEEGKLFGQHTWKVLELEGRTDKGTENTG